MTAGLDAVKVCRWVDHLRRESYAENTIHTYMTSLGNFLDFVGKPTVVDEAVEALGDEAPSRGDPEPRAWTNDEIVKLREAARGLGDPHPLLLSVGLCTGARYLELFALRWEDFEPFKHSVRIERQCVNEWSFETVKPKSKTSKRTALVLPEFWEFYRPGRHGRLFDLKSDARTHAIDKVYEAAGLKEPGVRYHALRHTYARIYLEDFGGSLNELKLFLGHASVTTTEKFYGHFSDEAALRLGADAVYGSGLSRRARRSA